MALGVGIGALFLVSRSASAAIQRQSDEELAVSMGMELERCGTDRACREAVIQYYTGMSRSFDPVAEQARQAAEEERIQQLREDRWSHL